MVKESTKFPIFRKYEGNRSYFRINSTTDFTEIQVMGSRLFKHDIQAKTFPDFQLIVDMINLHNNHWIESTTKEFDAAYSKHQESLTLVK